MLTAHIFDMGTALRFVTLQDGIVFDIIEIDGLKDLNKFRRKVKAMWTHTEAFGPIWTAARKEFLAAKPEDN